MLEASHAVSDPVNVWLVAGWGFTIWCLATRTLAWHLRWRMPLDDGREPFGGRGSQFFVLISLASRFQFCWCIANPEFRGLVLKASACCKYLQMHTYCRYCKCTWFPVSYLRVESMWVCAKAGYIPWLSTMDTHDISWYYSTIAIGDLRVVKRLCHTQIIPKCGQ